MQLEKRLRESRGGDGAFTSPCLSLLPYPSGCRSYRAYQQRACRGRVADPPDQMARAQRAAFLVEKGYVARRPSDMPTSTAALLSCTHPHTLTRLFFCSFCDNRGCCPGPLPVAYR